MTDNPKIVLEPAAAELAKATSAHPRIYEVPVEQGRKILEDLQNSPVEKLPAEIDTLKYSGDNGSFDVKVVIPESLKGQSGPHNVIFYVHGAGWAFGSFHTHEKLVRELAHRCKCVVLVPEYTLSPDAQYPVALEQMKQVLRELPKLAKEKGWSLDLLTVAGDSVGGNMAALLAFGGEGIPRFHKQLLFYPVTDARMNSGSYSEFADGYYLTKDGMVWFWDQYTKKEDERKKASPLCVETEKLKGLPPALIINAQADVLRDEGIAYSEKLREAGVSVEHHTFPAMVHDFVMLNSLDKTKACRGAMDTAVEWVVKHNK